MPFFIELRERERGKERDEEKRSKRKRGRGLIVGGMILSLLMGCNNGGENTASEKGLSEIGKSVENTFYSFFSLIADTLGFRVTKDTTKQEVGKYFSGLGEKIGKASEELEKVAVKAAADDGYKEGLLSKAIKEAVDEAKGVLNTLKGHVEVLKDIGDSGNVGEVAGDRQGVAATQDKLEVVYDAFKGIVETAKKEGVERLKKSQLKAAQASIGGGSNPENGARALAVGAAGAAAGPDATTIVSSVNGEEILTEIFDSVREDASVGNTGVADQNTSALKFARGDSTATNLNKATAKAAAVAGGIALRSLVQGSKLAAQDANDGKAVQSAGITAVNKLLVAVEDIVKKTVKNVLGKAKGEIDKARASKAIVQK